MTLRFEANRGQTDPKVKFLSRGPEEAVLALQTQEPKRTAAVLRIGLVGSNPEAQIDGLEELSAKSNYFVGRDSARWQTDVPSYAKVRYRQVYPGIDLVYYGNHRQLEHDFVAAPGADPCRVPAIGDIRARLSDAEVGGNMIGEALQAAQRPGTRQRLVLGELIEAAQF